MLLIYFRKQKSMFFTAPEIDEKLEKKLQQTLEKQRKYEQKGDYDSAKNAYEKVQEIKKQLEALKIKQLQNQTDQELQKLDKRMQTQLETLKQIADERIQSIKEQQQKKFAQLAISNQRQLQQRKNKLLQQTADSFQISAYLIKLKKLQNEYIKKEEFAQAKKVQTKYQQGYQKDHDIWQQLRLKKIQSQLQQIRTRQRKQMQQIRKNNDKKIEETKYDLVIEQKKTTKSFEQLKLQARSQMNQNITFWKDVTKKGKKSIVFDTLMGKSTVFKDLSESALFFDKN